MAAGLFLLTTVFGGPRALGDDEILVFAAASTAAAVDAVIDDPAKRTRDLGGSVNTETFGDFVTAALLA